LRVTDRSDFGVVEKIVQRNDGCHSSN
jgi:hypothetical protein